MTRTRSIASSRLRAMGKGIMIAGCMLLVGPVAAQVQIGVQAPLSGPDAVFGNQIRLGVEQAVADLNASGGFNGQRASVLFRDDGGDPKRGSDVAKAFVANKVGFVVGPFSSSVAIPASAIYGGAGTVAITPSATAPALTEAGFTSVIRLADRDDAADDVVARFLAGDGYTRVAILHDRTSHGKSVADAVRKPLIALGRKDVLYASVEKGETDMKPLVARLKSADVEIAFWAGTQVEAGLLIRQIRDSGLDTVVLGGVAIASDEFASVAGPAADGTLIVFPANPRRKPEASDLLRRLKAQAIEPEAYTFNAYAAVQVIQQAALAAGTLDPGAVARAIHTGMIFKTVLGDLAFDAKGDPTTPGLTVQSWHKGPGGSNDH